MAVELLTGHKGTAHITAADGRKMNRAIFGKNPLRLYGEYNSAYNNILGFLTVGIVAVGTYRMRMGSGLIYWNGMFIRSTGAEHSQNVASCEGYKVYLHYTKASNIETVEVLFTTSSYTNSLTFSDSTSEAYLLYGQYNNADGSDVTYYVPAFPDVIDRIKKMNISSAVTGNSEKVLLYEANLTNAENASGGEGITAYDLAEKSSNFEYIDVIINSGTGREKRFRLTQNEIISSDARLEWSRWNKFINEIHYYSFALYTNNSYNKINIGKLYRLVNNAFSADTSTNTIKIYGVGRIAI